jgi:DNA repair ATPase RecN
MIDQVKIQNYKSLKDVEMTFDSRLTVLVGANGSGKSSVLRCIHALCEMAGPTDISSNAVGDFVGRVQFTYSGRSEELQLLNMNESNKGVAQGVCLRTHPSPKFKTPGNGSPSLHDLARYTGIEPPEGMSVHPANDRHSTKN